MTRKWGLVLLLLIVLFGITACSNNDQVTESEPEEEETEQLQEEQQPTEPEEPEKPTFDNVYPFTGEKTNDDVSDRAVAVMVNNHPKARPQTGLTQADIVFEILAEYNITRFLAIFQSEKPDVIGPVRSARPYYFNLADDYDALYLHHGAATFIEDMLRAGAADYINGMYYDNDQHLFKREDFRVAPHNSYLLFDGVYDVAQQKGYSIEAEHRALPFLEEDEISSISGEQATEVSYSYTSTPVRYVYDSTTEKYARFNGDSQSVEFETEEPVELDNVLFVETYHEVVDDAGRREIDLQSGGNAYLLQKGKLQQVQWENIDGQILPVKDGEPLALVPGKTWVNVIPETSGLQDISVQ